MDINQKNTDQSNDVCNVESSSCAGEIQDPLKQEMELLQEELGKERNKYLRLFAEFENYKKRIQKERFDIFRSANEEILIDLIPVLDDFERGLKELKKSKEELTVKGVSAIQEKLIKVLKETGLNKIKIKKGR